MMIEHSEDEMRGAQEPTRAELAEKLERIEALLERTVADTVARLDLMQIYVDKILHISSIHKDSYEQRTARPYFPLDSTWALTKLESGQNFFINTSDRNIAPWIIMGGHWERNVDRVLCDYVRPGMQVLDIGAHFGYYTVKLGSMLGSSGRLHSFEPNPEVNAVCEENLKINGLAGIATLHKCALGDENTTATLTRSASNMSSANLIGEQDADFTVEVPVRRLDDVLTDDRPVDLIKLDAEGYEKRILDGAAGVLARSPECAIMIELSLDRWERAAPLDQLIPACGGNKALFAVRPDGTLDHTDIDSVRPFLLTCDFHENYFLVGNQERILSTVGHLLHA